MSSITVLLMKKREGEQAICMRFYVIISGCGFWANILRGWLPPSRTFSSYVPVFVIKASNNTYYLTIYSAIAEHEQNSHFPHVMLRYHTKVGIKASLTNKYISCNFNYKL